MKCASCKIQGKVLYRVNEIGIDGIFWCDECIKKKEPELHKNIMEDPETDIIKDIAEIIRS